MKKFLFATIAAIFTTMNANAQYEPGTWTLQPKIGIGTSSITNMEQMTIEGKNVSNEHSPAVSLGAEFEYQESDRFSIAIGADFSMQGTAWEKCRISGTKRYTDIRMELTYINIPVVANFYAAPGLALKAGFQFSYLTNADFVLTAEGLNNGYETTVESRSDMKEDFENFDLSIPIGISYELNNHLVIDARYKLGLLNISTDSSFDSQTNKNSVFMMTVGYKFSL